MLTPRTIMALNAFWVRPDIDSALLVSVLNVQGLDPVGPIVLITSVQGYLKIDQHT